ncbi:hypothetical protein DSO57_1034945 [Entomophthora muscae]|uniref:Uncharacterized protein n=1 Tax=Entomophthora muscae TaxID=34485 RepID=A0ACC2REF0_9FUNG|nr:hypothetical protein DSO57_1034945 [Entomophthora muscae]
MGRLSLPNTSQQLPYPISFSCRYRSRTRSSQYFTGEDSSREESAEVSGKMISSTEELKGVYRKG